MTHKSRRQHTRTQRYHTVHELQEHNATEQLVEFRNESANHNHLSYNSPSIPPSNHSPQNVQVQSNTVDNGPRTIGSLQSVRIGESHPQMLVQRHHIETGAHEQQIDQQERCHDYGKHGHIHQKAELPRRRPTLIEHVVHVPERRPKCVLVRCAGCIGPRPANYRLRQVHGNTGCGAANEAFEVECQRTFGGPKEVSTAVSDANYRTLDGTLEQWLVWIAWLAYLSRCTGASAGRIAATRGASTDTWTFARIRR